MLEPAKSENPRLIAVKFLKYSSVCDQTSTSQWDGRKDRQTTCRGNTALCVASCAKNDSAFKIF